MSDFKKRFVEVNNEMPEITLESACPHGQADSKNNEGL
jgi:hypothetical protein